MKDERLNAVKNFVRQGSKVADIGTDHAYLPIELVESKKVLKVIASDKNFFPCQAARKNISAAGLENFIEVRQGDGLKILQVGEVDTICISGMGGILIAEILKADAEILNSVSQLVLQPMNAADELKNFLQEVGWLVADEDLAEEGGIIYEIICAVKNPAEVSAVSKKNNSPLLKKFYAQKIEKLEKIEVEMKKSSAAVHTEKFIELQKKILELKLKQNAITF